MTLKYLSILAATIVAACILSTFAQSLSGFNTSQCGGSKRCINIPDNCQVQGNCQYQISYAPSGDGKSLIIELYGRRDSPQMQYVAIGFSNDARMVRFLRKDFLG
uniref:DOMON domain-containing protein n=1 Tax=Panagrolaimus sp. ES5 TaxID=591445 RepID=A0AC34FJJ5_9BILA